MFDQSVRLDDGVIAFQERIGPYFADYIPRGRQLVVSFENGAVRRETIVNPLRAGWLQQTILREGYSLLSLKMSVADWYRSPECRAFFEGAEFARLAGLHSQCLFTGSSMGGYAAAAFARCLPNSIALAFSPQSTMNLALVPWEAGRPRADRASVYDFTGADADAAMPSPNVSKLYVCYDPMMAIDRQHAQRFRGPNVTYLLMPMARHKTTVLLWQLEVFPALFRHAFCQDEGFFARLVRQRRRSEYYLKNMMELAGSGRRRAIVRQHIDALAAPTNGRE